MRRKKYSNKYWTEYSESDQIVRLWILRILVLLGGHRQLFSEDIIMDESVPRGLGLFGVLDLDDPEQVKRKGLLALKNLHASSELRKEYAQIPATLKDNVKRLSRLIGLSATDRRILEFTVMLKENTLLSSAAEYLGEVSTQKMIHFIAVILGLKVEAVRTALSRSGKLVKSGLLGIQEGYSIEINRKLDLISERFQEGLLISDDDPITLMNDILTPSPGPILSFQDFRHLEQVISLLRQYFKKTLQDGKIGVNAFFFGIPGTGKTQLARLIAQYLKCDLFEVSSEDEEGAPIDGNDRLKAYRLGQTLLRKRRAILLFDEVEDVFEGRGRFQWLPDEMRKAWINRILEDNPVPSIWISNSSSGLDRAYIRRFDVVIELPVPPKNQREKIVEQECGDIVNRETKARLSSSDVLAPALINRSATVVKTVADRIPASEHSNLVETLINNTLSAQGHAPILKNAATQLPSYYDLRYLNTKPKIEDVAKGIVASSSVRLCLYGPPGTGKTAFGRWVAKKMRTKLLVKRGSDIISSFVGETEQNIARAFRQASQNQSVLLFDEVDGFLRDRRYAHRSFEVTEVNEMLTQMEAFDGVFIASTNLMDDIDQAALRRFDLKIHFGYLKPDQAWKLFLCQCRDLRLKRPRKNLRPQVNRLATLTPGEFALAARQHRFRPITSPERLLEVLVDECRIKEEDSRKTGIGFIRSGGHG